MGVLGNEESGRGVELVCRIRTPLPSSFDW